MPVDQASPPDRTIDGWFRVGGATFAVEVKSNARGATVSQAVAALRAFRDRDHRAALLLVVPSMGETGAEICERFGVNWVDLNGNASIHENNMHVFIRGCHKSEPDGVSDITSSVNPFGRKAARVVHCLLTNPKRAWTHSDIQNATGLDKGYISKILSELLRHGFVLKLSKGRLNEIHVVDPMVLLDAWSENYRGPAPTMWSLIAARDGVEAAHKLAHILRDADMTYALTGLAAAAEYSKFGSYRRVDAYIAEVLPDDIEHRLHLGGDQRGRNVAIHLDPANASIGALGSTELRLASSVITYLDLAHIPERSNEAREQMRRYLERQWA